MRRAAAPEWVPGPIRLRAIHGRRRVRFLTGFRPRRQRGAGIGGAEEKVTPLAN
jgi:hypothetical protein